MNKKGFTLIELLIVIAIIAILAIIIFVALDPLTRFRAARDATRWSNTVAILDAVKLQQVDNGGEYSSIVSGLGAGTYYQIGTSGSGCESGCTARATSGGCANLSDLKTSGKLSQIPEDPVDGTEAQTKYYIMRSSTNAITIGACNPESISLLEVSR